MPGIKQWTAHLGQTLTIFGIDDKGETRAVVTWVPQKEGFAVACSTSDTSPEACATVAQAIAADLGGTASAVKPAYLPPLMDQESKDACVQGLRAGLADFQQILTKDGLQPQYDIRVICNNSNEVYEGTTPGNCWFWTTAKDAAGKIVQRSSFTSTQDLADACCAYDSPDEDVAGLVGPSVRLLCTGFGPNGFAGVRSSLVEYAKVGVLVAIVTTLIRHGVARTRPVSRIRSQGIVQGESVPLGSRGSARPGSRDAQRSSGHRWIHRRGPRDSSAPFASLGSAQAV
jgi:hypothetical protein